MICGGLTHFFLEQMSSPSAENHLADRMSLGIWIGLERKMSLVK
jgi:hypothetical protein